MLYETISLRGFEKAFYPNKSKLAKFLEWMKNTPGITFDLEKGPWLCGGAVRRFLSNTEDEGDYDIFFKDAASFNLLKEKFKGHIVNENKFNVAIEREGYKIQLVQFPKPENNSMFDVLDSFDFSLCMVGTDGNNIFYSIEPETEHNSLNNILDKRIVVNKITYGNSSMRRIFKYIKQGYFMCDGSISTFLNKIAETPDIINEEIKYID